MGFGSGISTQYCTTFVLNYTVSQIFLLLTKNMNPYKRKKLLAHVAITLCGTICLLTPALAQRDNVWEQSRKFTDILNIIKRNYVDTVNANNLTEQAIRGLLSTLDPHSVYLPPRAQRLENERFVGYAGIGIQFRLLNDSITVLSPTIGGPSDRLGIRCNDKIVKINNEPAVGIPTEEVPRKLRGHAGTKVSVLIKREGVKDLIPVTITRETVPNHSVDAGYIIPGTDVGYVYVNKFGANTAEDVRQSALALKAKGMKKMVLDLRWNGGGLLAQAYALADEFISAGKLIVFTKARSEELSERYVSTRGGVLENIPLVILINHASASASEIVAGAIQDLDRGLVVGETSFGKGLVQMPFLLPDSSALRLTIAHYYTPSGRCIQRPYDDKKKYFALEGREDLSEGENLTHRGEKDSTRPKYKTSSGRLVFGGGGIVPDYVVKPDTLSKLRIAINRSPVLPELIESYILQKGNFIKETYNNDIAAFLQNYQVDADMMEHFTALLTKNNIPWTKEDLQTEEVAVKRQIKAFITTYIWSTSVEFVAAYANNKELDRAVELFPEAMKVARDMVKQ